MSSVDRPFCVGVDLDNTIVCYDGVLARAAADVLGTGVELPIGKHAVKTAVERAAGADAWTLMQGELYGPRLREAVPYPGALEFFRACRARGVRVRIISHKTQRPALGPAYDLRAAALEWLEAHDWFASDGGGIASDDVEFHETFEDKLRAIGACAVFIDDLPAVFNAAEFPEGTRRLLFDPADAHRAAAGVERLRCWSDIRRDVLGDE